MNLTPIEDGVTHLNAYSNGKTELGRFLSNFAHCPIETLDGHFESVEGYWGWLSVSEENPRRDELRSAYGYNALALKKYLLQNGDKGRKDERFQEKIAAAIHAKCQTIEARRLFSENERLLELPIVHYYYRDTNMGPDVLDVTDKYPEFIDNVRREVDAYLKTVPSLFGIRRGVICQQVNCQNVMGAGLAKAIMEKYPQVSRRYHDTFRRNSKESLFGKADLVKISDDLYVANIYSQFYYGNPSKTGKVYTDAEKLVRAVDGICRKLPNLPIYLPHTRNLEGKEDYGIGCGYGGETWGKLSKMFEALGHKNLHLLDTKTGLVHELSDKIADKDRQDGIVGLHIINSLPHTKQKYPPCKGMGVIGETMEQFQADIAAKYGYKPLPTDVQSKALEIYLANLPVEFVPEKSSGRGGAKGGVQISGKRQPLFLKDKTKLSDGYDRIVVGHYGAFLEIDGSAMNKDVLKTKSGEEYRERDPYKDSVKYFWKTVGDTGAKIYEQRDGVDYADYKPGKYYISPYEVMGKEEVLAAGLPWNEEFLDFSPQEQVKVDIDPALYENRPVVFDLETTGFSSAKDEILQIAVVNDSGQVLLNTYTGTVSKKSWKDAEVVHHITPKMVQDKPVAACYSNIMSEIFGKASTVVGHNVPFDLRFVGDTMGVTVPKEKVFDTLRYFKNDCPYNDHHKLQDAVKEYYPGKYERYIEGAHDALTDALATAAVFRAQMERERSKKDDENREDSLAPDAEDIFK